MTLKNLPHAFGMHATGRSCRRTTHQQVYSQAHIKWPVRALLKVGRPNTETSEVKASWCSPRVILSQEQYYMHRLLFTVPRVCLCVHTQTHRYVDIRVVLVCCDHITGTVVMMLRIVSSSNRSCSSFRTAFNSLSLLEIAPFL